MECLTVAILLPSGVKPSEIESLRVLDAGWVFEIKIKRPKPFYDMTKLHKQWMYCFSTPTRLDTFVKSHFERLGFELFSKSLRSRADVQIISVGQIRFVMTFQSHIFASDHLELVYNDTRVLDGVLKASKNEYTVQTVEYDHI